ncbi:hypothetical protein YB2330_003658 [Saitoella coloradoensis]
MDTQSTIDVLVIGAGPVGLFLASLLKNYGHSVRIIEKDKTPNQWSKALNVNTRTLEMMEFVGCVEEVLGRGLGNAGGTCGWADRIRTCLAALKPVSKMLSVMSLNHAGFASKLVMTWSFGVKPNIMSEQWSSKKASKVLRKLVANIWWVAMIHFPDEKNASSAIRHGRDTAEESPVLADFERLCNSRHANIKIKSATWLTRFHVNERMVETLRKGRVFLAGDAAHCHSPAGGMGMNTGLQDAMNLGWKLSMALHKTTNNENALLDSYNQERLPIIRTVLDNSSDLLRLVVDTSLTKRGSFFTAHTHSNQAGMASDLPSDPALDAADLKVVKQEDAEEGGLVKVPHARSNSVALEAVKMDESAEKVKLEDTAGPAPTATLNDGSGNITEPPSDATLPTLKDEEDDGEICYTPPSSPPPPIPRPHRCSGCWSSWPRKAHLSIIRHAESTGNVAHLLQGRTDAPLTVFGHEQAARLASNTIFSEYPPTKVFASPLQRAKHTAEKLVTGLKAADTDTEAGRVDTGLEMMLDAGLVERDLGRRENTSWKMEKKFPLAEPDNLGGERKEPFKRRVRMCAQQYLRLTWELVDRGEEHVHIVIVTHGLFLAEFLWQVESLVSEYSGTNPQDILCGIPPVANTSIWTYELKFPAPSMGRNDWRFAAKMGPARMNNISHLNNMSRQRGGLGSMAYDKRQKTLDGFFRKGGRGS